MRLLGVDPGLVNLGLCFAEFDEATHTLTPEACACINIGDYADGHVVDKFIAFMKAEAEHMSNCDVFIMERQPMFSGGESVSCLLYSHFRDKAVLIAPNMLHTHFDLRGTYDQRKELVTRIAEPHLGHLPGWQVAPRTHDCADAFLLLKCYVDRNFKKPVARKMRLKLSEYAYVPTKAVTCPQTEFVPKKSRFFDEPFCNTLA